jgi:hypothetical protein
MERNNMPIPKTEEYYLHVQDFVDGYIGPFPTPDAAMEHFVWCRDVRGDGASFMSISNTPPNPNAFGVHMTPEVDKSERSLF